MVSKAGVESSRIHHGFRDSGDLGFSGPARVPQCAQIFSEAEKARGLTSSAPMLNPPSFATLRGFRRFEPPPPPDVSGAHL